MRSPRVHLLTLGCAKNEADSRAIAERLTSAGFPLEEDPDSADVLVLNTCSFVSDAAEESVEAALEAATVWKPETDDRRVVVVGCLPARYGTDLEVEMPEVDAFVGVGQADAVVAAVAEATGTDFASPVVGPGIGPFAYLNVCDGCDRSCSFCTIPSIRGAFRSRDTREVLEEGRRLIESGARELVLVGQDVSRYGADAGTTLATLVRDLAALPDLLWLRLMYLQPDGVTHELLEAMASESAICHYMDLPLQHASAPVLRRMRRSGDAESFLALLDRVRETLPDVVLRTTLISGFPGETDDDVEILVDFLRQAELDHVGVFVYSPEEGTHAADLPDQVPSAVARERAQYVMDTAEEVSLGRRRQLTGSTLGVLVDDAEDSLAVGRWYGQAPEVDGVVYLDRSAPIGAFVEATVDEVAASDLIATIRT